VAVPLAMGSGIVGTDFLGDAAVVAPLLGGGINATLPFNPDAPWKDGPAVFTVAITNPGDDTPTVIDVGGVSASWQVSGQTSFSCEAETDTLMHTFQTIDLRGKWLRWDHGTLGTWAGQITDVESDYQNGTTEIAATDFSSLLEARRIAKVYDTGEAAPAGALAKRVVIDAAREAGGYTWIQNVFADQTGDPLKIQLRGGKVSEALDTISNRSMDEWWVDWQRQLWWQHRRGTNKTGSVQLVEGRHIVDHRYSLALGPIVNDLLAVPADEPYSTSNSFTVDDDASILKVGRRQDQRTYGSVVTESTIRPLALKDLNKLKSLGDTIQFDLVNIDGCFGTFGDGDSISLLLPSVGRIMQVRIMARSYDTDQAVLTVSGDVES
jgi:hypothetical protein